MRHQRPQPWDAARLRDGTSHGDRSVTTPASVNHSRAAVASMARYYADIASGSGKADRGLRRVHELDARDPASLRPPSGAGHRVCPECGVMERNLEAFPVGNPVGAAAVCVGNPGKAPGSRHDASLPVLRIGNDTDRGARTAKAPTGRLTERRSARPHLRGRIAPKCALSGDTPRRAPDGLAAAQRFCADILRRFRLRAQRGRRRLPVMRVRRLDKAQDERPTHHAPASSFNLGHNGPPHARRHPSTEHRRRC